MHWWNRRNLVAGISIWLAIFSAHDSARAAEFCVDSASGLLDAIFTAQANGADDVIRLVQGTYEGNFLYSSQESNSLLIEGGYTAGCASRQVHSANTVLDGKEGATVLVLNATAKANFSVDGLTIRNGKATTNTNGGGMYVKTVSGTFRLSNSTISANTANQGYSYGGGVYISSAATVTLTNNDITGNTSSNGMDGGGAYITGATTVNLTDNNISNNTSSRYGGGVRVYTGTTTVNLTNNIISNNTTGESGGGVYITGATTVNLIKNDISNNTSDYHGGGIAVSGSTVTLDDNNISGNSSSSGGGAYVSGGSMVTITNNDIRSNSSGRSSSSKCYGGGIYLATAGIASLTNNVFTSNMVGKNGNYGYGGGIYLDKPNGASLTNNTISDNWINESSLGGCGGGVAILLYDNGDYAKIFNNIIWNNQGRNNCNLKTYGNPALGNDVYIDNDGNNEWNWSPVTVFNNDLDPNDTAFFIAETTFKGNSEKFDNNIDADPGFLDVQTGDFHLAASSPCMNAGSNDAPGMLEKDKDGNPRVTNGDPDDQITDAVVDMGAYELPGNSPGEPPNPPLVSCATPTNNTTPTWSWISGGGGGTGHYRYRIDSTTPDDPWTEIEATTYTPATPLSEGIHTLEVEERNEAVQWSTPGNKSITIDTTAPDTIITDNPGNPATISDACFGFASTEASSTFQCKIDNGIYEACTSQKCFTGLSDGNHSFSVKAMDAAGNTDGSPASYAWKIDSTAPNAPVVSATTPTNDTTPTWTWTPGGGGNGKYHCRLDGGAWSAETTATSFTPGSPLGEGTHTLDVQERDDAGNWSASGSKPVDIDTTAPTAPVVTAATPTNDTTPTWTWTPGGGGNGKYHYRLDGGAWSAETTARSFTPVSALAEGTHTLEVQERDAAGNWSASANKPVDIDTTAPTAPVITATTPTTDTTPTWSWTPGGGGTGKYRYRLDSGAWSAETTATSFTPGNGLGQGTHTLDVQERDDAGNWSASGSKAVVIDTTPPKAPLVSATSPTNDTTPTWTWTPGGGGNGKYRYRLDGGGWSEETTVTNFTPGSPLGEGTHTLEVQERDDAGNWSNSDSKPVVIDITAPSPPVVTAATPTNDTTPTWSWMPIGGGNGKYRYRLDSGAWSAETTVTSFTPLNALAEGTHTLEVQERDDVGNWSASGSKAVVIDITVPSAPVVTAATPTNDTTPTWTWTPGGGGNGKYHYGLDGGAWSEETTATSFTPVNVLTEGPHSLDVQERDDVGNWSASGSKLVVIDITAPNAPVVTAATPTNDTTPTWTWTPGGGGNGKYHYRLDSGAWSEETTATSFTPENALGEGTHTLDVQERDDAGNWSTSSSPKPVVIDTTAPNDPQVSCPKRTKDTTPTWTWTPGGGGNGIYRYELDPVDCNDLAGAPETTATSYTPANALSKGKHTLCVQERDTAGNWSISGSGSTRVMSR